MTEASSIEFYSRAQADAKFAEVSELQDLADDVSGLDTRLIAAEGDIDTLETAQGLLSGRMTAAEGRLTTAEGDIDNLETTVGGLATVARTGSYNDLSDKPTFAQVQSDWAQTDAQAVDYIKNKPTIPAGAVLYSGTGQNTDGAITQKGTTDALALKADRTEIPTFTAQSGYWTITY